MWKRLKELLSGGEADSVPADGNAPFHVYRVRLPDGFRDVVSLLPQDIAFASGLGGGAVIGLCEQLLEDGVSITDANFRPNKLFVELLHDVIATEGPALPELKAAAHRQQTGHVYVIDGRTPTPEGEVPPSDIIGAFEVKEGAVVPHSYRPNANHRLFSSTGLFKLDPTLHEKLMERITKASAVHQVDDSRGRSKE